MFTISISLSDTHTQIINFFLWSLLCSCELGKNHMAFFSVVSDSKTIRYMITITSYIWQIKQKIAHARVYYENVETNVLGVWKGAPYDIGIVWWCLFREIEGTEKWCCVRNAKKSDGFLIYVYGIGYRFRNAQLHMLFDIRCDAPYRNHTTEDVRARCLA